jgi:hypothetical protein
VILTSLISVALLTVLHISRSHAADDAAAQGASIGQIIWTKGVVQATQPAGTPRTLQRRSAIYEHDVITTGKDGSGEMTFADSTLVALNPDTEMKVDTYKYNKADPAQDKSVMSLVKGGFRTITGAIPKENPDAYKITTPVATIGVRGTQYATVLSPTKGLLVRIESGTIEVTNDAGKIELHKCDGPNTAGKGCNSFGIVTSFTISPSVAQAMPPELGNVTPVTPPPAGMAPTGGTAPSTPTPTAVPAKTVSNFCVGLLEDIYSRISKLFA